MFRCICICVSIAEWPDGATAVREFPGHPSVAALIYTPAEITTFLTE
jgi:hypothetical protein